MKNSKPLDKHAQQCFQLRNYFLSIRNYLGMEDRKPMAQSLKITQSVAFEFWHFPQKIVLLKLTCLVTLYRASTIILLLFYCCQLVN